MLMHINGRTANYTQIRRLYPNTSFPVNPNEDLIRALGHYVEPTPRPSGDVVTQGQPEERDGKWYQTWNVRDFTEEELEQQRLASIPQTITPRQARLALLQAGLLDQVSAALDSLPSPDKEAALIEWEYATTIERDSEWVTNLSGALELTPEQTDDLFITASTL